MTTTLTPSYDALFLSSGSIELPYQIISVEGADAEKFLQGQLSIDVTDLSEGKVDMATANTPKGRIYGLFKILKEDQRFLLRVHNTMAEAVFARLNKYKVFFNCALKIEHSYKVFGVVKPVITKHERPTRGTFVKTGSTLLIALDNTTELYEKWTDDNLLEDNAGNVAAEDWSVMECINGIPEIYPETCESFILQYLNLHELGAVSFKKGCYTGQEIIARMKFLGKLKKKTFLITCPEKSNVSPGSPLLDKNNAKCGEVVRMHYSSTIGSVGLAVLPIIDDEKGRTPIRVSSESEAFFTIHALQY